jgi:protein-tyrosine phosphatase
LGADLDTLTPSPSSPYLLLVVCTANICRSPMVTALLRAKIEAAGLDEQIDVRSAGIPGLEGAAASRHAVEALAERGLDLSTHVACSLTPQDIRQADLILVMEEAHRQRIFHRSPEHLYKVMLFHELVGEHTDLPDPYGGEREEYAATLARIDYVLEAGWSRLWESVRRLAERGSV